MSAGEWEDLIYKGSWGSLIYKVYFFRPENPTHLQRWLEQVYIVEHLELVATTGDYFIFRPIAHDVEKDAE